MAKSQERRYQRRTAAGGSVKESGSLEAFGLREVMKFKKEEGVEEMIVLYIIIDRRRQMRYTETMTKPIGSLLLKYGCRLESSTTTSNKRGRK